MNHCRLPVAALIAGALTLPVHAGRPLQTEDAGVLEPGACEVEGATQRLSASGAAATATSLQFGCGIGWAGQAALRVATDKGGGGRTRDVAVVGKTGLWTGPGDHPAALSLAWGLGWAKVDGASWRRAAIGLNLVYSRPLAHDLTLHANLGHGRDEVGSLRSTTWGLAVEHAGFGALAPMAELFGDDRQAPWWNLGLRYTAVPERVFLDLSYGHQFASQRPRWVTLGFKLAY